MSLPTLVSLVLSALLIVATDDESSQAPYLHQIPTYTAKNGEKVYPRPASRVALDETGQKMAVIAYGYCAVVDTSTGKTLFELDDVPDSRVYLEDGRVVIRTKNTKEKKNSKKRRRSKEPPKEKITYRDPVTGKSVKLRTPKNDLRITNTYLGKPYDMSSWKYKDKIPVLTVHRTKRGKKIAPTPEDRLWAPWDNKWRSGGPNPGGKCPTATVHQRGLVSEDRSKVVAILQNGQLCVWEIGKSDPAHTVKVAGTLDFGLDSRVDLQWVEDGRVAVLSHGGTFSMVDPKTGDRHVVPMVKARNSGSANEGFIAELGPGTRMSLSKDGSKLVRILQYRRTLLDDSASTYSELELYDVKSGTRLWHVRGALQGPHDMKPLRDAFLSPNGERLALAMADGRVILVATNDSSEAEQAMN